MFGDAFRPQRLHITLSLSDDTLARLAALFTAQGGGSEAVQQQLQAVLDSLGELKIMATETERKWQDAINQMGTAFNAYNARVNELVTSLKDKIAAIDDKSFDATDELQAMTDLTSQMNSLLASTPIIQSVPETQTTIPAPADVPPPPTEIKTDVAPVTDTAPLTDPATQPTS